MFFVVTIPRPQSFARTYLVPGMHVLVVNKSDQQLHTSMYQLYHVPFTWHTFLSIINSSTGTY